MEMMASETDDQNDINKDEAATDGTKSPCHIRPDDAGYWNAFLGWYIFVLHAVIAAAIAIGVTQIHGHSFGVGGDINVFELGPNRKLYQAQVTGLVSLALVVLRLVAGSCSVLLAWRVVYVLLEKRGLTLGELTLTINWKLPLLFRFGRRSVATKGRARIVAPGSSLLRVLWPSVAVLLLWPQAIAPPLLTSSLSWIPGTTVVGKQAEMVFPFAGNSSWWDGFFFEEQLTGAVIEGAAMSSRDPGYAFGSRREGMIPARRHFNSNLNLPNGSKIDITVPYFYVDRIEWVNAENEVPYTNAGQTLYTDVNKRFEIRNRGTTALVRDKGWEYLEALPDRPRVVTREALVSVKLDTVLVGEELPDGTKTDLETPCPTDSDVFGKLPDVAQWQRDITGYGEVVAHDCYIFARATLIAGLHPGQQCDVTTVAAGSSTTEHYASCLLPPVNSPDDLEEDWISDLSLDFLSETLKFTSLQSYVSPSITDNLEDYTRGILTLGYHAAWGGVTRRFRGSSDFETATYWPGEPVVFASVSRQRVFAWLGLTLSLTASALLVAGYQHTAVAVKTVRDPTVAALTMDISAVAHSGRSYGLCNAVDLNDGDQELPRLVWKRRDVGGDGESCIRRLAFVDDESSLLRNQEA